MLRTLTPLLVVLAVSCAGGGEPAPEAPSGPEKETGGNLLHTEQPWMVNSWVPESVKVGEEFEIRVILINRSEDEQILESVHFSDEYFQGVEVVKMSPSATSRDSHMGPGIREYPLGLRVPGKQQGGMVLVVRAVTEGTYDAAVTVCVTHPSSRWTERYHAVCAGHADVVEGMATNWQPLAHGVRLTKIEAKVEGE